MMIFLKKFFLVWWLLLFGWLPTLAHATFDGHLSVQSQAVADHKIMRLADQQTLSWADWLKELSVQDYIILGEYHDSKAQHLSALKLLQQLHAIRPQGALLLEMLRVDQQPLADQVAKNPPKNLRSLEKKLNWQASWRWQLYADIVAHAISQGYPLVATNLTKAEVGQIMQGAEPIKGYDSTTPAIQQAIAEMIIKNHGFAKDELAEADQQIVAKMVQVQQFRDRRMAQKILTSPMPNLLLAGNFHAKKDVGVSQHLQDLQYGESLPKKGVVVLMVNSNDVANIQKNQADYVWVIDETKP